MQVKTLMKNPASVVGEDASLARARAMLACAPVSWLPVVAASGPVGMVGEREIRLGEASTVPTLAQWECRPLLDHVQVRHVMTRAWAALSPESGVREAARVMAARRLECVLVVDGGEVRFALEGIRVGDVMARDVLAVAPETPLSEAARLMRDTQRSALPVIRAGRLAGMLTVFDLLEFHASVIDS